jgi:tetratricopeptide (TPR) repeat protein
MIVGATSLVILASVAVTQIRPLFGPKTSLERALYYSERRDFRQAVDKLDSEEPTAWEQARETFRGLSRAHPDLAWPILYGAVTLEKIGRKVGDAARVDDAKLELKEALNKPDYEEALTQRLREDPRSVTLLVRQAFWMVSNSSDAQTLKKGHDLLQGALMIEPGNLETLSLLASVEEKIGRPDDAIRHYSQAIKLAEAAPKKYARALATCRGTLLVLLTSRADGQIDNGPSAAERRKAEATLGQVEATLEALDRSLKDESIPASLGKMESYRTVYRGTIASGLAVLAADEGDIEEAARRFQEAKRQFREALRLAEKYPRLGMREEVVSRLKLNETRSRRFLCAR